MVGTEQAAFLGILIFVASGILLVVIGSLVNASLQPRGVSQEALCTYESGEEPVVGTWSSFNARFYDVAVAFLIFEVETVLLLPCVTVWTHHGLNEATGGVWKHYAAISVTLFASLLGVGLAYVWNQGKLAVIKSSRLVPPLAHAVPRLYYDRFNRRYATVITKQKRSVPPR